jgi:hypothetical protein
MKTDSNKRTQIFVNNNQPQYRPKTQLGLLKTDLSLTQDPTFDLLEEPISNVFYKNFYQNGNHNMRNVDSVVSNQDEFF